MKTLLVFLFFSTACMASEKFSVKDVGISLTTPDGWIHDVKDTFGYVLRNPAARQNQKIRIHLSRSDATSAKDAARLALEGINEIKARDGHPLEVVISSGSVKTRSGIKGWRSAHGFKGSSKGPYIVHYFFQCPDKRVFCVCAYVMYDSKVEKNYGDIILQGLDFIRH